MQPTASETTTIERVSVIRPFKVIALIAEIIALILLIITIAVNDWLRADGVQMGLWKECTWADGVPEVCVNNQTRAWIQAVAAFCLIPMFLIIGAVILTILGILNKDYRRKTLFYRIAMILMIVSAVCLVIALIIFPVKFRDEMMSYSKSKWYFQWCYGLAWGVFCFCVGSAVLLWLDKESKEIYYKEKTSKGASSSFEYEPQTY